jgi:hypothetical protein
MIFENRFVLYPANYFRYNLVVIGLAAKSDVALVLSEHITALNLHSPHPVRAVRSDNDGEFICTAFHTFLQGLGARFEPTVPYNPRPIALTSGQTAPSSLELVPFSVMPVYLLICCFPAL